MLGFVGPVILLPMIAPLETPPIPSATPLTDDPVPVVVAYDDEHAYRRAIQLLVRTGGQLRDANALRLQPWSFSALESPRLREHACAGAARSPIVVISISGTEIPESTRTWLSSHCVGPRQSAALFVALVAPQTRQTHQHRMVLDFLRQIATRAGFTFLAPASVTASACASTP